MRTKAPVQLTWNNLNYTVSAGPGGPCGGEVGEKKILSGVSGYARPGELMAIVGPSGM